MKKLITIAALLAFTTGVHAQTKCRASFNAYKVIQIGMSYAKVVELVGCEGAEQSESEGGGAKLTMYTWDGEPKGELSVMFTNGKLSNKSKIGLIPMVRHRR